MSDLEAQQLLDGYHASATLLARLREWMSTMNISAIVVKSMQQDASALVDALAVTQDRSATP